MQLGTEHRSKYQLYADALAANATRSYPRPLDMGPDKTSTSTSHPWPKAYVAQPVMWNNWARVQIGTPIQEELRPMSADAPRPGLLENPMYEQAKPAAKARYMQAPYLVGAMAEGAGIDKRPTTAISTYQLASKKHKDLLEDAAVGLAARSAQIQAWTHSRSLRSQPISPDPSPYLTSSMDAYRVRPVADAQQHRLRRYVTSGQASGDSLESAPVHVEVPPLKGGTVQHATRFLGVRAPDGTRRLMEMDTTGGPAPIRARHPCPYPLPDPAQSVPYISSQPISHEMETYTWPAEPLLKSSGPAEPIVRAGPI